VIYNSKKEKRKLQKKYISNIYKNRYRPEKGKNKNKSYNNNENKCKFNKNVENSLKNKK
jgi:hypothetical protein